MRHIDNGGPPHEPSRAIGLLIVKYWEIDNMRSLACGKKSLREYSHIVFVALAVGVCLFGQQALAADHLIPADVSTFNGSDVRPGDTVTLAAGERGPLRIIDLQGTSRAPIIVRNDPNGRGPAVIRREQADTGGFVFVCRNCEQ
jgi:hypothetical protein